MVTYCCISSTVASREAGLCFLRNAFERMLNMASASWEDLPSFLSGPEATWRSGGHPAVDQLGERNLVFLPRAHARPCPPHGDGEQHMRT